MMAIWLRRCDKSEVADVCCCTRPIVARKFLADGIIIEVDGLVEVESATREPRMVCKSTTLEGVSIVVKTVDDGLCYLRWERAAIEGTVELHNELKMPDTYRMPIFSDIACLLSPCLRSVAHSTV